MNRPQFEQAVLTFLEELTPGDTRNAAFYKAWFKTLDAAAFNAWVDDLKNERAVLSIVTPAHQPTGWSVENNFRLAKKYGLEFYERIRIRGKNNLPEVVTPIRHLVLDLPIRRMSQTSDKKQKVPKDTKTVDALTGQVTGKSKGAQLSGVETQLLSAMGLEAFIVEAIKFRGGDLKGRVVLNGFLSQEGSASLNTLWDFSSGVVSTTNLKTFLTAAHLKNTL